MGFGFLVLEFLRGLGFGFWSSCGGPGAGFGVWGFLGTAGGRILESELSKNRGKLSCGARQNCNFPSFLPQKIPAEHLHISGTLRTAMCWFLWVTHRYVSVTTLNYRCIGARGARGKNVADRYGLGFGFWSSREGWVWGFAFGVRPQNPRPGAG